MAHDSRTPDRDDDGRTPLTDADQPAGGDDGTESRLVADNEAEEDTIRALDPEAPSA